MESTPLSQASKAVAHDDDLYCSDPSCAYCKDLREAEEQWKRVHAEIGAPRNSERLSSTD